MSEGIWIKKSLVAAVAAGTLVLAGCNDESNDNDTDGNTTTSQQTSSTPENYVSVNKPTGSITGLVTDTNGYPIEGATVYLGEQSVTTNAGGQYYFSDVAVSQTVKNDNDEYTQAVALTIVPPSGYLGATVTVMPKAQIFNGSETDADSNEVTNPITTFIDGFNAQAGTAVLPATTATVTGVLRNSDTGEALSGVQLALDMLSTDSGVDQEQTQDGVNTSYNTGAFTATTSANGEFTFSNVPADAILKLAANGYTIDPADSEANTSDEHTAYSMQDVPATPISSADSIAPWVKLVSEVVSQTASRGMLNDDTDSVITLEFSEVMSSIDENSIRVRDVDAGEYLNFSHNLDGKTLTITIAETDTNGDPQDRLLARAGHEIDVLLLVDDFRDTANPANALGIVKNGGANTDVGFDSNLTTSVGSQYVKLALKSYIEANTDASPVDLTDSQQSKDARGVDDLTKLQDDNSAFWDIDDMSVGIQQLNSADDDDTSGTADAQERMQALASALAGTIGSLESTDVEANTAGIQFAATNASYYELDVLDSEGTSKFNGLARVELDGGTFDPAPNANRFVADVEEGENLYLVLQGVVPGDEVQITPFDEFGYAGNLSAETLVDNVAPTTVLQNAYGTGADNNNGSVVSLQYGDGGEQSSNPDAEIGTPYLNVTPRMMSIVDGTADGTDEDGLEGIYTLKPLFELNTENEIADDPNFGELFIDELNFNAGNIAGSTPGVYDANAYADWRLIENERTIGVAFSEDIVLNDAAAIDHTQVANAVLSDFATNNDVLRQDDNGTTYADLIQFDIDDVVVFANGDHDAVIDFTTAIEDAAGNAGASNAKVVVGDAMPPLVESAEYTGNAFSIQFNEAISVDTSTQIVLGGVAISLDQDTVDAFNLQGDKTVLNVLPSAWGEDLDRTTVFSLAQYDEANPDEGSFPNDLHHHARLDFSDIEDLRGNSWSDVSTGATATSEEFFFYQPDFAAVDATGAFAVTGTDNGTTLGSDQISVRFTGTHPIDLSSWDANNDGTVSQNEFESQFTFTDDNGGGVDIDTADDSHTLSITNGGKTLTFNFVLTGNVEAGDNIEVNAAWESQWDSTETSVPANSDVDFNP